MFLNTSPAVDWLLFSEETGYINCFSLNSVSLSLLPVQRNGAQLLVR